MKQCDSQLQRKTVNETELKNCSAQKFPFMSFNSNKKIHNNFLFVSRLQNDFRMR